MQFKVSALRQYISHKYISLPYTQWKFCNTKRIYIQINLAYVTTILGLYQWSWPSTNAVTEGVSELPMVKFVPKKSDKSDKATAGNVVDDTGLPNQEQLFGYSFAFVNRKMAMESAGMSTAMPSLTKEQKRQRRTRNGPWQMQSIC